MTSCPDRWQWYKRWRNEYLKMKSWWQHIHHGYRMSHHGQQQSGIMIIVRIMKRNKPETLMHPPFMTKMSKPKDGTFVWPWGLMAGKAGTPLPARHREQHHHPLKMTESLVHFLSQEWKKSSCHLWKKSSCHFLNITSWPIIVCPWEGIFMKNPVTGAGSDGTTMANRIASHWSRKLWKSIQKSILPGIGWWQRWKQYGNSSNHHWCHWMVQGDLIMIPVTDYAGIYGTSSVFGMTWTIWWGSSCIWQSPDRSYWNHWKFWTICWSDSLWYQFRHHRTFSRFDRYLFVRFRLVHIKRISLWFSIIAKSLLPYSLISGMRIF